MQADALSAKDAFFTIQHVDVFNVHID